MRAMNKGLLKTLTLSLGGLWLLDGILQLQPAMFAGTFVNAVLAPTLVGQPRVIAGILGFGIHLWSMNMFWSNMAAAAVQLAIGALLLSPLWRSSQGAIRFGLWLSIAWAAIVWTFGEGFGMLATGSASFYTGAPGAALLYLILALFLLDAMNERTDAPLSKLPVTAGIIFLAGAALNLVPMFWTPGMLAKLAMTPAIAGPLGALGAQGTLLGNFIAVDILIFLGIFLLLVPNRPAAWIVLAFLFIVWWISQGFGGIATFPNGTATDLNSAPLLVLFILPIFFTQRSPQPRS